MSKKRTQNVAASVRQQLLNIIRTTGDNPTLIWSRYATERFLYRISISNYAGEFVLKGAMLFMVWTGKIYRPTFDLDLLGYGENSKQNLIDIFKEVCVLDVKDDGLVFKPGTIQITPIRENQHYKGQRVNLIAYLERSRIPIQVDIGFGDAVTPNPKKVNYPTILDFPSPSVSAYPPETVIAEKFHAVVTLGMGNSRMKDFYDLYIIADTFNPDLSLSV